MGAIDFTSPTLKVLYVCTALLGLKMLIMSLLTARMRFKKRIFANPEDKIIKNSRVQYNHPDVERVRRAHQNDIENIPVFLTAAFFYAFLNPDSVIAMVLFVVFTVARFAHTYVYAISVKPQPARFICYAIGFSVTCFMLFNVIRHTRAAM